MKNRTHLSVWSLAIPVAVMLPVATASAVLDKFEPYVTATVLRDTNLFRSSDNKEDDTIAYVGGGVKTDLKVSRQHFLVDAEAVRAKYNDFDDLDHTRLNGRAAWAWQVGNLWSGQLGTRYTRETRSFTHTLIREKDMRTRKVGYLDAGYQIHPDWQLVGGLSYTTVDYQERKILERDYTSGQFEVKYRNTLNTRVGVRAKHTDFDLKDRQVAGVDIDNDYTENEISGVFYWEASAKSKLEALLGYTWQSFDELDDREYNGSTGRLTYRWIMTGKTTFDLSVWRETSSRNDEVINYVLNKGVSISPVWSVTDLVSIRGTLGYENDDFKARNDILTALGEERRDDDIYLASIYTSWRPRRNLDLSAGYRWEKRDSNIKIRDFTDNQVEARVAFSF